MQQLTLTIDLTAENLENLKAFCQETKAETVVKKPAAKAKATVEKEPKAKAPAKAAVQEQEAESESQKQETKQKAPDKTLTLTDVRAVALKISKAGKSDTLKEIFAKFDATKLSEIPAERYDELMKELAAVDA